MGLESRMSRSQSTHNFWSFVVIWFGQVVSAIGSGLTSFALGVWVYQRTGSATQFAIIWLCAILPGILMLPLIGSLVDRWDRRWTMLLSDIGSGLSILIIVTLVLTNNFAIWHIYVATALSSAFRSFQWISYATLTTVLVPKQQLGRAGGMIQFGEAAMQLIAPLLAGILLTTIRLEGLLLVDIITFVVAIITLLSVRIPKVEPTAEAEDEKTGMLAGVAYGWTYIISRPGLLGLLMMIAIFNFTMGVVELLVTPLVLSFTTAAVLGLVLSVSGIGQLLGTVAMSVWGGPKRRVQGIVGFLIIEGLAFMLGGLQSSAQLVALAAFIFLFCYPIIASSSQALWQSKVPVQVQGRVFSVRSMIAWSSQPLAYLCAGLLADRVFGPLLAEDGALVGSVGQLIGVGPGRGIGLLFIVMGMITILATVVGYLNGHVRRLEDELPDAVADEPQVAAEMPLLADSPS